MRAKMTLRTLIAVFVLLSMMLGDVTAATAQSAPNGPKRGSPGRFLDICAPVDRATLKYPSQFRYGVSGDSLQTDFYDKEKGINADGYRPVRITGYMDGKDVRFATKWTKDGGPGWRSWFGMTGQSFHDEYENLKASHRPVDVSGYNTPDGVRYNVVWEENFDNIDWYVHRDVSRPGMQTLVDQYGISGYAPTRVEGYALDGKLHFISTWVKVPNGCRWMMHNQMTRQEYEDKLDQYSGTLRLTHLDSYVDKGEVFYAGIWVHQSGPGQEVRSNRDWYLFQRELNNNWCDGLVLDNVYAADISSSTVRFGGIWTVAEVPQIDATSSLNARVAKEVNCADGRGGAAVINLTTGEDVMSHADQTFASSSTIKTGILYGLLRKADDEGIDIWTATLDSGVQYGTNQNGFNVAGALTANTDYTLAFLAQTMVENSNNWATNRLIDFVGFQQINQELDDLGLKRTRLRRYMTGIGSPSVDGNGGPDGDYAAGIDNTTTPREMVTLQILVHENDGLLSFNSLNFYWNTMALSGATKGNANDLMATGVDANWQTFVSFGNKTGRNTWGYDSLGNVTAQIGDYAHKPQVADHVQLSETGRLVFDDDEVVFFAIYLDESDGPNPGTMPSTIACFGMEIAREYSGQTTGVAPAQCQ